jgi:hypothetical protein
MENTKIISEKPEVEYKRITKETRSNLIMSTFLTSVFVLIFVLNLFFLDLTIVQTYLFAGILILLYNILIPFLLKPVIVSEKQVTKTKTVEKTVEKPVEKKVIVTKTIPMKVKKKKAEPLPKYVGSTEEKRYHTRSCRLSKLIKPKYKLQDDRPSYFTRKGFEACKVCIKKEKKI